MADPSIVNIYVPSYPNLTGRPDMALMVVLVGGLDSEHTPFYKAYAAVVEYSQEPGARQAIAEKVQAMGTPLSYNAARGHFPGLLDEQYTG